MPSPSADTPPPDAAPPQPVDAAPLLERVEKFLSRQHLLIAWVLLFQVLALAYAPSFRSPFLYDDLANIVYNEDFRADHPLRAIVSGHSSSMQFDRRPVGGILSWLNFASFGLNVTAFRAVNLLIHWLCAGALGIVAVQCARGCGLRTPRVFALLLVALWALHPIHSSAVIYISQRMESLMTLFFLVSCACLLRAHPSRPSSRWWRTGSVVAACLCLLSKENGAGLPLVLLVTDRLLVAGSWRAIWKNQKPFYLSLLMAWITSGGWILNGPRVAEWDDLETLANPWRYFQTECHVVFGYLRLLVWPTPIVFAPVPRIAEMWIDWLPYLAALAAMFGLLAWHARRRPWLWVPWLTILVVLAPTSSFIPVPLEPAFDYRMHLPAAPALALLLLAGWWLARRLLIGESWMLAIAAACMTILTGTTYFRAEVFGRPESIWADVVRKEPENVKAWYNLSAFLLGQDRPQEARLAADAGHSVNQVFQLPWIDAQYHRLLGLMAEKEENWAEALNQFEQAAVAVSDRTEFQLGRARALLKLNRAAEALQLLEPLIAEGKGDVETHLWRTMALAKLNRFDEARESSLRVEQARALPLDLEDSRQLMRKQLTEPPAQGGPTSKTDL